jgi:hypothetical protein
MTPLISLGYLFYNFEGDDLLMLDLPSCASRENSRKWSFGLSWYSYLFFDNARGIIMISKGSGLSSTYSIFPI